MIRNNFKMKVYGMFYLFMKLVHIFSVFIYGGFLFTDNLFFARIQEKVTQQEYAKMRELFMTFVRKVVPKSLIVAVISGIYLFYENFGVIADEGLNSFQIVLIIKAFFGLWLGLRGILQVFFKINPLVFKSHRFPFLVVIIIIALSQVMHFV